MAVNVLKESNVLKITEGSEIKYFISAWCSIYFTSDSVVITDQGQEIAKKILFSDFEYDGTTYSTESDIYDILKDKIG